MEDERIAKLLTQRKCLAPLADQWTAVEDVLSGPNAIKAASRDDKAGGHGRRQSRYLPRNLNEHPEEYKKRLDITPVFCETPNVLQGRLGAMFRQPPTLELPEQLAYLQTAATAAGASFLDEQVKAAELAQVHGFCGVLIDRQPLPADVSGRDVSVEEAQQRNLGRLLLALYAAPQILDWDDDRKGLVWVRLLEEDEIRDPVTGEGQTIQTVRVVTRETITVYEIITPAQGERILRVGEPVPHGAKDALGPCVPFVFFHPFPGRDGIGRSVLSGVAEADLAATRVLSELVWMLHMMVPILALKTGRSEDEVQNIGLGVSRFLVLKNKNTAAGDDGEDLNFVQLDPTAANSLMQMYRDFTERARGQSSRTDAVGVAGPVAQSGVALAWKFKTGEERLLHLLAKCLERGFERILQICALAEGADLGEHAISWPDSFDVEGPEYALREGTSLLPVFAEYGLNSAVVATLRKIFEAWIRNPSDELEDAFETELEQLAQRNLRPDALLNPPPMDEGDASGDTNASENNDGGDGNGA